MATKHYVTEPTGYLEPKVGKSGVAAWPAKTVIELFQTTVERFPNEPALLYKRPENGRLPDEFSVITYREYWAYCMQFAKALVKLDVACFKITNILGFNS
eukprot:gene5952-7401_t